MTSEELEKALRNIGPVCAKQLTDAGIDTPEKLRELGAKKAFLKVIERGGFHSEFNAAYLYALWGAIHDVDWRDVPAPVKEDFKAFTKQLRDT